MIEPEDLRNPSVRAAFSLIELLVVCAVIGLLAAILLPALARSRQQMQLLLCQTNERQLATAFLMYAQHNHGRLPGFENDYEADWLGSGNSRPPKIRRNPQDGTLFPYMGRNMAAYACPLDTVKRPGQNCRWSYSAHFLLSGAWPENLRGAHYRRAADPNALGNFNDINHTADMRSMDGVPLIIEEDPRWDLLNNDEGAWSNASCVSNRHMKGPAGGWGNVAYVDSHAGRVDLPPRQTAFDPTFRYFRATSLCVRTAGGKWVAGRAWFPWMSGVPDQIPYGYIDRAPSAESSGVLHQ